MKIIHAEYKYYEFYNNRKDIILQFIKCMINRVFIEDNHGAKDY